MNTLQALERIGGSFQGKTHLAESAGVLESDAEATLVMENHSLINRELYLEAGRALSRRWTRYAAKVIGILLIVAGIASSEGFLMIGGVIITVLSTFSWLIIVYRDFNKLRKRHRAEAWQKTVRFYSNRIEIEAGAGNVSTFSYSAIRRLRETRNMLIIVFGKKQPANMLRKDSFTLGTNDLAMSFISEMREIQAHDSVIRRSSLSADDGRRNQNT
jgi:hypothetical protein